jgi:hypothetical protein
MGRLPGSSSSCWIAGPYRHCRLCGRAVGRVRAGTVAGGSPSAPYCLRVWRRGAGPCSCTVRWADTLVADRQRRRRAAALVTGTPGRARPASWSERHRGCAFGQVAVSPNRASGRPGQVGRKVKPGVALGGQGHAHPINRPLASSLAAGGATVGCVTSYCHPSQTPGARAPGGCRLGCRYWQARDLGAITAHDCSGHGAGLARADCDRLTRAG